MLKGRPCKHFLKGNSEVVEYVSVTHTISITIAMLFIKDKQLISRLSGIYRILILLQTIHCNPVPGLNLIWSLPIGIY